MHPRVRRTLTFTLTGALLATGALATSCATPPERTSNPGPVEQPKPDTETTTGASTTGEDEGDGEDDGEDEGEEPTEGPSRPISNPGPVAPPEGGGDE